MIQAWNAAAREAKFTRVLPPIHEVLVVAALFAGVLATFRL